MTDNTDSTASTQHPLWCVDTIEASYQSGKEGVRSNGAIYVRAPTASAALARAEAMRAGKPELVATSTATLARLQSVLDEMRVSVGTLGIEWSDVPGSVSKLVLCAYDLLAELRNPTTAVAAPGPQPPSFSAGDTALTSEQVGVPGGSTPPAATIPTIRVRACIAVVNGKQWAVAGNCEFNDAQMHATAVDVAGWFSGDDVQIDFATIDVPLRQPAEITGAVETKEE